MSLELLGLVSDTPLGDCVAKSLLRYLADNSSPDGFIGATNYSAMISDTEIPLEVIRDTLLTFHRMGLVCGAFESEGVLQISVPLLGRDLRAHYGFHRIGPSREGDGERKS